MKRQAQALIVALLFAGCATTHFVVDRSLGPGEIFSRVRARNLRVSTVEGSGLITIESPEGSHNGSFDARVKKPDSVRVVLRGPFGVHVGTLLLSRQAFLYYNRLDHTALTGKPEGPTLRSILKLSMPFDQMLDAFTGEFPPAAAADSLVADSVDDDGYHLTYRAGGEVKMYDIDPEHFIVRSYRVFDSTGAEVITAESSRIRMADSVAMPKFLRVVFPAEKRSVTIVYDNIEINRPVECAFTLPEHTEVMTRE